MAANLRRNVHGNMGITQTGYIGEGTRCEVVMETARDVYFDEVDSLKPGRELWECLARGVREGLITQSEADRMAAFWGKYAGGLLRV